MNRNNFDQYKLNSSKNDFFFFLLKKLLRSKHPKPINVSLLYFMVSFVGTLVFGLITGHFTDDSFGIMMKDDYINLVNIGLIAPIAIGLFTNLYNKIDDIFYSLRRNNVFVVTSDSEKDIKKIIAKTQKAYENKFVVFISLILSIITNVFLMLLLKGAWNGIYGGITSFYFRLFIILNFYIVPLIFYKSIITIISMRDVFNLKLKLQPLHPDNCSGIKPLGDLAIAINYFAVLILLYFTILAVFDPSLKQNILSSLIFFCLFFIVFFLSIIIFILSILKAHKQMIRDKRELLLSLHVEFQENYESFLTILSNGDFKKILSDKIISINNMYLIAERMPVWPFDTKSISRFFTTISLPLIIYIIQLVMNSSSIIYHLDELKIFKMLFD